MLKMQMILRTGESPIWMKEIEVTGKLNYKFTDDEIEEAIMSAEEYLATIVKNREVVADIPAGADSPGGTD